MHTAISYNDAAPFWDKIAPRYAKKPVADPAAYEEKLARVRALLRAEDRVLEIGCGTGSTALRLASRVAEITATDISIQTRNDIVMGTNGINTTLDATGTFSATSVTGDVNLQDAAIEKSPG